MSPAGRPTDSPKIYRPSYRLSQEDMDRLTECCDALKVSASEAIRMGIKMLHAEVTKNE